MVLFSSPLTKCVFPKPPFISLCKESTNLEFLFTSVEWHIAASLICHRTLILSLRAVAQAADLQLLVRSTIDALKQTKKRKHADQQSEGDTQISDTSIYNSQKMNSHVYWFLSLYRLLK